MGVSLRNKILNDQLQRMSGVTDAIECLDAVKWNRTGHKKNCSMETGGKMDAAGDAHKHLMISRESGPIDGLMIMMTSEDPIHYIGTSL